VANLLLGPAYDYSEGFGISYPLAMVACGGVLVSACIYVESSPQESALTYGRVDSHAMDELALAVGPEDEAPVEEAPVDNSDEIVEQMDDHSEERLEFQYSTRQLLRRLLWDPTSSVPYFGALFLLALMGWTVVLTVLFEIPVFAIADQLLERCGSTPLLLLSMLCYVLRVVGYSLIPNGHVVYALFLEPLHGVTYACSQTAVVDFVAGTCRSVPKPRDKASFTCFVAAAPFSVS
jgi:MFS_1 like family